MTLSPNTPSHKYLEIALALLLIEQWQTQARNLSMAAFLDQIRANAILHSFHRGVDTLRILSLSPEEGGAEHDFETLDERDVKLRMERQRSKLLASARAAQQLILAHSYNSIASSSSSSSSSPSSAVAAGSDGDENTKSPSPKDPVLLRIRQLINGLTRLIATFGVDELVGRQVEREVLVALSLQWT